MKREEKGAPDRRVVVSHKGEIFLIIPWGKLIKICPVRARFADPKPD